MKAGDDTVTVTAESGVQYTFNVTVIGVKGIAVESMPNKLNYSTREAFDETGLKVVKLYNDGTTEECTEYTVSKNFNSLLKGVQTITVTYGKHTTTFNVFVSAALVGDANFDGKISSIDSNYLKRVMAGIENRTEYTDEYFVCDINGDGQINAIDSALLKRSLVG